MPKPLHRIDDRERRARLARRHHLAPAARVASAVDVARDLVCLHATDPSTVYLAAWARLKRPSLEAVDRALYEDRSLLRMLAMRRTMWVVPVEDAPMLQSAATADVARRERRRNEEIAARLRVGDVGKFLRDAERATLAALERRGEATAVELSRDVPALARKLKVAVGKKYEAQIGIGSRVLIVLAAEGRLVRARPRGTWISSQYRWSTMKKWLGRPLADVPTESAQTELVRRWLARFGPGTEADIAWWTGWPLRSVRGALARIRAVEVELDGGTGFVVPGDLERTKPSPPWVALLPALDPTTMGWRDRDWYLGEHRRALFDTSGNAGPSIWVDGRIAGGWAIRPNGEVVTRLLEDVGRAATSAVETEAARLTKWLEKVAVVPRFPTPLAKELVSSH